MCCAARHGLLHKQGDGDHGQQGHADYGGDYPFVDKMYSSSVKVKDLLSWTEQRVLELLDWTEFSLRQLRRPDRALEL